MDRVFCFLLGWEWKILNQCTPASKKALRKYGSALVIIMSLWAFIGYNIADRYFDVSVFGAILSAIGFSCLIWFVERVIILSGKSKAIAFIRGLMALCMAAIGAIIIDQMMFYKDIEQGKIDYITEKVNCELPKNLKLIEDNRTTRQAEIDSLIIINSVLQDEINKNPMIRITNYRDEQTGKKDSLGNNIKERLYSTTNIENPKNNELKRNQQRIDILQEQVDNLFIESQNKEKELRGQYAENFGLLSELKVTIGVIGEHWVSITFYFIFLAFFLFIECLIVFTKLFDRECDYESLIENQKEARIIEIKKLVNIE